MGWRGLILGFCGQVAGRGPPVVLVHGFGASVGHWRKNIPALAKHHQVASIHSTVRWGSCLMSIHSLHPGWPWHAEIREPVNLYFVYSLFSVGHQHVERPVKGLMSIMLHEMMCAGRVSHASLSCMLLNDITSAINKHGRI